MKLPLLLAAKPKLAIGPTVMLLQGKYLIETDIVDSEVEICLDQITSLPIIGKECSLNLEYDACCKINIKTPGSEDSITIYAKRLE